MATLIKKLFRSRKSPQSTGTTAPASPPGDVQLPDWSDKTRIRASLKLLDELEDTAFQDWLSEQTELTPLAYALDIANPDRRTQVLDHILAQYTAQPDRFQSALSQALDVFDSPTGNLFRALPTEDLRKLMVSRPVAQLRELAMSHPSAVVRENAAELIQDVDNLEALVRHARGKDKKVYRIARERLKALRDMEVEQVRLREQAQHLISEIRQLAESQDDNLYTGKFAALQQKWATLPETVRQRHLETWQTYEARCQKRADALREAGLAQQQQQQEAEAKRREREATLQVLAQAIEELKSLKRPDASRLSALDALCKTQETRWLEATRQQPIEKAEKDQYLKSMGALHHYLLACQRLIEHEEEINRLIALTDEAALTSREQALRQIVEDVRWPEEFPLPEPLQIIETVVGHIETRRSEALQDQKKRLVTVQRQLERMAEHLADGHLKKARRLGRDIGHQLDLLPERKTQNLRAELLRLTGQLRELEDWKGFATRPKFEALIARMEHLAEQHMDPHDKARAIKALQQEWRDLGGSSDQALWTRFKAAADTAYEPLKAFFEEEDKLKAANLARRQEIVEQLQRFLDEADWSNPDWKAVDKVHRTAREEWRKFYPVDLRAGRKLQKQFNHLLDTLDARLDEERRRNEALKADIVERARALVDEPDIRLATQQAKALQKEWESIGITRYKKDRALWKQFRSACDAVFARLGEARKAADAEREARLAQAAGLIEALEALVNDDDPGTLEAASANLREAIDKLGLSGADARPLMDRFKAACTQIDNRLKTLRAETLRQRFNDILNGHVETAPDTEDAARTVQDTLLLLEILAGLPSPEAERARRMALQVERLNNGLHGAVNGDEVRQFESLLARLASCYHKLNDNQITRIDATLSAFAQTHH